MILDKRRPEPPETMRQARTWQGFNNRYLADGLCYTCAAQAAYGHQLGFSRSHPPCLECADLIALLPVGRTNGWRSYEVATGFSKSPVHGADDSAEERESNV